VTDDLGDVRAIRIEDEMRVSYLDYAMSVIVARALPDVRDGLKPVHRRILYTMGEMGLSATSSFRKCAAIVGEVMGKYHPHGDGAIYDALVRLAQDFSMRYPLVDGQGNFGSVDGDDAAAMRYTEARLTGIAAEMLADIDRETVDYVENYDGTQKEPSVLPAKLPNLLINGSSGIAVGMATNIPPHHLGEICDATIALIDDPDLTSDDLCKFVMGPDFPTGGTIFRFEKQRNALTGEWETVDAIRQMYAHGRGRVVMRAQVAFEEVRGDRTAIIVSELPYQVNKATLLEKMADLVKDKKIDGIADLRDESDRDGMRIYIEIKRDANPHKVLNNLFKHTPMQLAFNMNMLALVDGQPQTLPLRSVLQHYVDHRREIVRRRTEFDLGKARARAHILEGLKIALDNLDAVIQTIRESQDVDLARTNLMSRFELSELQAQAILDMRLARLAALERKKIEDEYFQVIQLIAELEDILANPARVLAIIKDELVELKRKYAGDRRTRVADDASREMTDEDLIADEDVVITISGRGYIKRQPVGTYRRQHRGGKGIIGHVTREEDAVEHLLVANTHDWALFFTNRGRVFSAKVHAIPDASRQAKGMAIINLPGVQVDSGEVPVATIVLPDFEPGHYLVMATRRGIIKKTPLEQFERVRSTGIRAISIHDNDELAWVDVSGGDDDIIIATAQGMLARFEEDEVRPMGRDAAGVIGIRLLKREGDSVVAMRVVEPDADLLVLTETGYGKRVGISEFRRKHRGGQGVRLIALEGRKTGLVAAVQQVTDLDEELVLISEGGQVIRTDTNTINRYSAQARGVIVMRLAEGDRVAAIAAFRPDLRTVTAWATMAPPPRVTLTHPADRRPAGRDGANGLRRAGGGTLVRGPVRDLPRERQPGSRPEDRGLPRIHVREGRGLPVREREHLRQDPGQRPGEGRVRRPADVPPGQPVDHGAPDHDRRLQACVGRADHRGHPVLRLRPLGQEGPAARAHHGPADRRHDHGRGRGPGALDGSPPGPDPGLLQHPGR
jgi:DNA gyrase subunit A